MLVQQVRREQVELQGLLVLVDQLVRLVQQGQQVKPDRPVLVVRQGMRERQDLQERAVLLVQQVKQAQQDLREQQVQQV